MSAYLTATDDDNERQRQRRRRQRRQPLCVALRCTNGVHVSMQRNFRCPDPVFHVSLPYGDGRRQRATTTATATPTTTTTMCRPSVHEWSTCEHATQLSMSRSSFSCQRTLRRRTTTTSDNDTDDDAGADNHYVSLLASLYLS